MKTPEHFFRDWESHVFGYGYGSGESHVLGALKQFFHASRSDGNYDYKILEESCTPAVAWLLINALAHANVIEYGTSPRYGWLTDNGKQLLEYVRSKSVEELVEAATDYDESYAHCFPDYCNCVGDKNAGCCHLNPFWYRRSW